MDLWPSKFDSKQRSHLKELLVKPVPELHSYYELKKCKAKNIKNIVPCNIYRSYYIAILSKILIDE